MLNKLISLIVLFVLFFGVSNESTIDEFSKFKNGKVLSSAIIQSTIVQDDCNECEDKGCDEQEGHCSHHCNGMHNLTIVKSKVSLNNVLVRNVKSFWHYTHYYNSPTLDPSLKPPTLS